jgi:Undecaprenyl-phosphate galactose phosphotransferase WbaP
MLKKFASLVAMLLADFAAVGVSFFLAYLLRTTVYTHFFSDIVNLPVYLSLYLNSAHFFIIWVVIFSYEKLYTKRYAFWEEARLLFKGNTLTFALLMVAVFMAKKDFFYSRLVIVTAWVISTLLLPVFRNITKILLIKLRLWGKKVAIIGTAESSTALIASIKENRMLGYQIVGCFTDNQERIGLSVSGIKILDHMDKIADWKDRTGFEDIMVTLPELPREKLIPLMKKWERISDGIRYIPRTGDLVSTGVEIENIGKILALSVRKNLHKPWNLFVKAVFEYITTVVIFFLSLPLFLVIAIAIKLDSPGPVLFVQDRYGKQKKTIRLIKFRSMFLDADARLERYLQSHPDAEQELRLYNKIKNHDPRVTRVGRFLRKFSLDELPQLLNVLKGDMSLVGPRPYIAGELKKMEELTSVLLQLKPGITGLWQTSGRSSLPFKERVNIDEYYIRNWSLWLDIVILLKTIKVTASGSGAF